MIERKISVVRLGSHDRIYLLIFDFDLTNENLTWYQTKILNSKKPNHSKIRPRTCHIFCHYFSSVPNIHAFVTLRATSLFEFFFFNLSLLVYSKSII